MAFDDRLTALLLSFLVGAVVGYLVRLLQDILADVKGMKEELDEVDEIVKTELVTRKDEKGYFRLSFNVIAMLLVVGLAFYASVVSQRASNDSKKAVETNAIVTYCNLDITTKALTALNERSTYTASQTSANVELQKAFAEFFNLLLHVPPFPDEEQLAAAQKYQASLNNFVKIAEKTTDKIYKNPFPTVAQLVNCIQRGEVPGDNLELYLEKMKTEGEQ